MTDKKKKKKKKIISIYDIQLYKIFGFNVSIEKQIFYWKNISHCLKIYKFNLI